MSEWRRYDERGVRELSPRNPRATVCGHCGRGWDDDHVTGVTPAPSARCPFEYDHEYPEPCGARSREHTCTLQAGHSGTHIMRGMVEMNVAVWDDHDCDAIA